MTNLLSQQESTEYVQLEYYKAQIERLRGALELADQFITNGVEFGYIALPDPPDPALKTPGIIRGTLEETP